MNYQHAFHAGNFADVHKHIVLTRILDYLRGKPAPFRIIDSHAGAGRYDLAGPEAIRGGEWRDGIGHVFGADCPASVRSLLKPYLDVITALNPNGGLRLYPGSPLIAKAFMRRQDRLIACELEPRAAASLKTALRGDVRVKILELDGWVGINANVPPKERRGLVLIDPPYEQTDDFTRLSGVLAEAHRKWPTGIYMLWYPIKERDAPDALGRRLRRIGVPKVMRSEMMLSVRRTEGGLAGSGLILVNPPFTLAAELEILLPAVGRLFTPAAAHRLDWLAGELSAKH
ncbi:MAG TPA: 23S rRNA (adenine(2030)-N(6))-methyltransferase RlmJ [Xanthobacteraceae bacterium]|jgi:23S rRNA (adenine2030-N6)-methyltransferase|nr:23S rRNA (adenine(2030)-N(6))-methyltransferase RlmJ [Xanthobacteraceae bacterium]